MKFSQKYMATPMGEFSFESPTGYEPFFNPLQGLCDVCREPTFWADVDFQCFICSEECQKVLNDEYSKAMLRPMDDTR